RRQKIPKRANLLAYHAGFDFPRPTRDRRHPNSAFVQIAFDSAQRTARTKKRRRVAAFLLRAVVGAEEDERVLVEAEVFQPLERLGREKIMAVFHFFRRIARAEFTFAGNFVLERHALLVPPKECRPVVVRVVLVQIAEEIIEALPRRHTARFGLAESPFPDY